MLLALLTLLLGCAHRTEQRDRGVRPALSTSEALSQALQPRRRAIVIGINRYEDPTFPALKHAQSDAQAIARLLSRQPEGGFDEVILLEDVDRDTITRTLLQAQADLRREDTLVVYFSGHGIGIEQGEGDWRRYLLPADSRSQDLDSSALELTSLQSFFSTLAPTRKALIIDACFSGDGKSIPRPAGTEAVRPPLLPTQAAAMGPGEAHLFATSAGRPSREDDRLGHGVYTWFLIEALSLGFTEADLNDDGVVTAYEAHDYARGRTILHTAMVQIPEATFRIVGEGDLVLAGLPDARKRREEALVYLYPAAGQQLHGASIVVDGRNRGMLPGAMPLTPGRHHIGLYDTDGSPLAEGHLTLRSGGVYPASELARMVKGPKWTVVTLGTATAGPPTLQSGLLGAEAQLIRRDNAGYWRGLIGMVGVGVGRGESAAGVSRTGQWLDLGLGVQHDRRRLRYRASWTVGAVNLPPTDADTGWVFGVTGPRAAGGLVLGPGWAVTVEGRSQAAWLDPALTSSPTLLPWLTLGVGLEGAF